MLKKRHTVIFLEWNLKEFQFNWNLNWNLNFKKVKSSADMLFIVDLWRFPYNIHTARCVTNLEQCVCFLFCFFFKLNCYIYPGIRLQNLKLGVLKTMP